MQKKLSYCNKQFFSLFSCQPLSLIMEIIKCFISLEYNSQKAYKYILEEKKMFCSKNTIDRVYNEIREVIYKYLKVAYLSEEFGSLNKNEFFSIDESLFCHKNDSQIWIVGAVNNNTKDFRLEGVLSRDSNILKKFVHKYIPKGNHIVSDGWAGYHFLDLPNSGYRHFSHNHGEGSFGLGLQSTSHIESIWGVLKQKIHATYNSFPSKKIMYFLKEAEYKYKVRNMSAYLKIKDFFGCWDLLNILADEEMEPNEFLRDSDSDEE